MKKFVLISLFSLYISNSYAQGEVGSFNVQPKVGLNVSHLVSTSNRPSIGLTAGLEWEYQIADRVSFSFGVMYSMQGAKSKTLHEIMPVGEEGKDAYVDAEATLKMNYIQVPLLLNVYVARGWAFKAGFQFGINTTSNYKSYVSVTQSGQNASISEKGDLSDLGVKVNDFGYSVPVGVSYEFHDIVFECRYNIGVPKFFKDINVTNNVFQLIVGMKFGR